MLKPGTEAPPFRGTNQRGEPVSLESLTAKGPLVLFFYPKDFTAVCTKEVCMFRDIYAELAETGVEVAGVSVDDDESHRRFSDAHGLPYHLVSDTTKTISRAYEALGLLGFSAKRITYVIDPDRRIRAAFHHELSAAKHLRDVRAALRGHAPPS